MATKTKSDTEDKTEGAATRRISAMRARSTPKSDDDADDDSEKPVVSDPHSDEVEVDVDEPDDDEDDEDDVPASRAAKRRQRGQNLVAQERERREAVERENAELKQYLQHSMQQQRAPQAPAAPAKPEPDEDDRELAAVMSESRLLANRVQQVNAKGGGTQAELDEIDQKYLELEQRKTDAQYRKAMKRHGATQQPADGLNEQQRFVRMTVQTEYPDVLANQRARVYADGQRNIMIAKGAPDDLPTLRKALDLARSEFKLGPAAKAPIAPTSATRQARYISVSRGGGGDDGARSPSTVKLNSMQQRIAEERYPNMSAAKAHQAWARARIKSGTLKA